MGALPHEPAGVSGRGCYGTGRNGTDSVACPSPHPPIPTNKGVAVRANNDGVVKGEVEPPVNLVFTVAHDAVAATFTFMRHTGERMDLAELVYEVDAAVSA